MRMLNNLKAFLIPKEKRELGQKIFQKKYSQKENFNELRARFNKNLNEIPKTKGEFIIPLWRDFINGIEKNLAKGIEINFLRIPEINGAMVMDKGGKLMKKELEFLNKNANDKVLKKILEEDLVGRPKIICEKYLTSHNAIHNLYHLTNFLSYSKIRIDYGKTIIEWGGGYGHLSSMIKRLEKENTHIIIDLPIFSCIQWIYLSAIYGEQEINLIKGKKDKIIKGKINLIPITLLDEKKIKGDIFISNWGLSESSDRAQDYVMKNNWFDTKFVFIGLQKGNEEIPFAKNLMKKLVKEGAFLKELPYQKGNYYAILKK